MKMTLVKLKKLNPCRAGLAFANECQGDFEKIWETCDQGDWLIWLLRRTKQIDKPTAVRLAVECARHVLPIFVSKQDDKRPHLALEAAEAWIKDPTPENQELCKKAAYADAAAAAYAAAADAARKKERLWQANKIRELFKNPCSN